jgi:hypothetical protein
LKETSEIGLYGSCIAFNADSIEAFESVLSGALASSNPAAVVELHVPLSDSDATGAVVDEYVTKHLLWRVVQEPVPHGLKGTRAVNIPGLFVLQREISKRAAVLGQLQCVLHTECKGLGNVRLVDTGDRYFGLMIASAAAETLSSLYKGCPAILDFTKGWPMEGGIERGCRSGLGFECYFLRLNSCTAGLRRELLEDPTTSQLRQNLDDLRDQKWLYAKYRSKKVPHVVGGPKNRSVVFGSDCHEAAQLAGTQDDMRCSKTDPKKIRSNPYYSQLTLFAALAFRPNRSTRIEVRERIALWKAAHPSWAARPSSSTCAALHVRHGDKLTPYWLGNVKGKGPVDDAMEVNRAFNISLEEYVGAAVASLSRNGELPARPQVLLMTDDLDIVRAASQILQAEVFTVPTGRPLVSLSETNAHGFGNLDHEKECRTEAQRKHWRRLGVECSFDYYHDPMTGKPAGSEEMLQWLVAWELMSTCQIYVRHAGSSFGSLIYGIISDHRLSRGLPCSKSVFAMGKREVVMLRDCSGHIDSVAKNHERFEF